MHPSAYEDARRFVEQHLSGRTNLKIADVGSFDVNGSLRPLFDRPGWEYVGLDMVAGPNVDLLLSEDYHWPEIANGSFDVVISSQTLEHVRHPWKWVPEVARICAPGGLIYLCSPNTWGYHEYPVDCWRVWPQGMRALFEEAGLRTLEAYSAGNDTTGIAQRLTDAELAESRRIPRLTLLCATSGRPTLRQTLEAIKRQQLLPGDEVLLVHDGVASQKTRELWAQAQLPGRVIELAEGPHHDWGHTPRNIALPQARGDYVVHLDDDDVCAPTALTAVRKAIQSSPGRFFVFRIVYPDGTTLWADQEVRFGNLGTALFVHPTGILLAHFGPTHGGDYEFVSQTIRLNPERQVKWQPEVITLIQPHQTWSNPQFVDLAQQTGDEGRYDCQKGWQEFVGRYFKNKTILDVGAGLGQSRERLAHGGNHVVLQDPAPGMPVDYTQPIFEMESQGWDVITCFDVLEHIAEPVPFLEQLLRLARTTLVITTPNYWVSRCGNPFHVREYTPPQLIQQLEQLPRVKAIQCFTSAHEDGSFPCPRTVEEFVRSEAPRLAVFLELAPIKDQERSISGVDASATSAVLSRRSLEHLTPCECTEPGWCERHQCEKSMFMQEMCRRSTEWYELWESRDGPGQTATKAMEFSRTQPCQHLGPLKNTVQCPSCFGNVQIKVFACNLREECTRSRKIDRVASCLSCSDYIAY